MTRTEMIAALDQEIQRLETARALLRKSRDVTASLELPERGRQGATRRRMSAEGRRRIVEAQRRRWAKQRKQTAKGK